MQMLVTDVIVNMATSLVRPLLFIFSEKLALDFLFGGEVTSQHTTKFALEKFVVRYELAIKTLNRAIILSVAFIPFALVPYGNMVTIPIIDLEVSPQNWFRLCPAISYGLQLYTLVALCWFLLLRRGLAVLTDNADNTEDFGEVANIVLTGFVGSAWMILSVRRHLPSKLHLIWFIPLTLLLFIVLLSPSGLCAYFVIGLFETGDLWPAIVYSVMLLPSLTLAIVLAGICVVAGVREVMP